MEEGNVSKIIENDNCETEDVDNTEDEYKGPTSDAPAKTIPKPRTRKDTVEEPPQSEADASPAWFDEVVSILTPREEQAENGEQKEEPSPQNTEKAGDEEPGFLNGVTGAFSAIFTAQDGGEESDADADKGFFDKMSGSMSGIIPEALRFWEDDGSKSPRHHFNEGAIFKTMFSAENSASEQDPEESEVQTPLSPASTAAAARNESQNLSCLRKEGTPAKNKGCRVQFEVVEWRNHEVMLDGSGGLPSSGTPLGLGWKVEDERWAYIDDFEAERETVRRPIEIFMMDGFVPPKARAQRFTEVGYTKEDVSGAELATFKANRRRKASNMDLSDMEE